MGRQHRQEFDFRLTIAGFSLQALRRPKTDTAIRSQYVKADGVIPILRCRPFPVKTALIELSVVDDHCPRVHHANRLGLNDWNEWIYRSVGFFIKPNESLRMSNADC